VNAESVAEIPEARLLDLIYSDVGFYSAITVPPQTRGPIKYRLRVQPADVGLAKTAFGDVDSLLLSQSDASSARAVQFKRIKITAETFHTGQPNRLRELAKVVHQANALVKVGFSFVWVAVIVVVDARQATGGQLRLVSGLGALVDLIKQSVPMSQLDPSAGAYLLEAVQPVDKPFSDSGMFGGQMLRDATQRLQPAALTTAIARLFS
jgi:hypothetical protein